MKILLVRPPRHFWPFNSESSSFWQPLGFAYMAAVLRENDFHDVKIIDCPPLKMGWKSLQATLEKEKPDVVGIGEEVASSNEGLRLAYLAKELNPNVITVAGGHFFSYVAKDILPNHPIDFIVRLEGEISFTNLIKELSKPKREQNFRTVNGIAFLSSAGKVIETMPQPLIENIDDLPIPAYDLLPMELYGNHSKNHPGLAAIEHSRGCIDTCKFCTLWRTMGNEIGNSKVIPKYRQRSVDRQMEEVEILVHKYKKKTLGWVDSTWNADPNWTKEFCQRLLDDNINVWQTAWARADCVVRDEKKGILKTQVDSGLVQVVVGAERLNQQELNNLQKNYSPNTVLKCFKIFREKYPSVYTIGSFIYGMPDDTKEDLKLLKKAVHANFCDMVFLLPYTPYPGTTLWEELKDSELLEIKDFGKYNLHLPVMRTKHLTRKQLDRWLKSVIFSYAIFNPSTLFKRIVTAKDQRKRRVQLSLAKKILATGTTKFWNTITGQTKGFEYHYGVRPKWYES